MFFFCNEWLFSFFKYNKAQANLLIENAKTKAETRFVNSGFRQ